MTNTETLASLKLLLRLRGFLEPPKFLRTKVHQCKENQFLNVQTFEEYKYSTDKMETVFIEDLTKLLLQQQDPKNLKLL